MSTQQNSQLEGTAAVPLQRLVRHSPATLTDPDHIQGTNASFWTCPTCKLPYVFADYIERAPVCNGLSAEVPQEKTSEPTRDPCQACAGRVYQFLVTGRKIKRSVCKDCGGTGMVPNAKLSDASEAFAEAHGSSVRSTTYKQSEEK